MTPRHRLLVIPAIALVVAVVLLVTFWVGSGQRPPAPDVREAGLPALDSATAWLNGGPMTRDSLADHPVVMLLWSDTDPRSFELLSRLQRWYEAYEGRGLRVIGVHTPEFSFATDRSVPARVVEQLGLRFPIALDPGYEIRNEVSADLDRPSTPSNRWDPILVVSDTAGRIVVNSGSQGLGAVERAIRGQLRGSLPERSMPAGAPGLAVGGEPGIEETRFAYLGTARAQGGPLAQTLPGRTATFTAQFRYQEEGDAYVVHPVGRWTPTAEGLVAARGGAANFVAIRYLGGSVSAVMAPPGSGQGRVWILADDAWLGPTIRGDDVHVDSRGASYVDVTGARLYRLVRDTQSHVLKLSPDEPGTTFYSFVFQPL